MIDIAIIGDGRLGRAIAAALRAASRPVTGPLGRCPDAGSAHVLLCVPDTEIAAAAAAVPQLDGRLVGHASGATTLEPLAPHEAFSLHPLMTVTRDAPADVLAGAGAAVAGSTPAARAFAEQLAADLGMTTIEVPDGDRAAYHAAASIASNFLVTLEAAAERLAATASVPREALAPLVRAAVEDWANLGAGDALTGPIARGDDAVVTRQRMAVAARTPELIGLFDTLAAATRDLARAHAAAGDAEVKA